MLEPMFLSIAGIVNPEMDGAGTAAIYFVPTCLLAIAIFGFGVSKEREGGKPWVKFLSIPVLIGTAWICYDYFAFATNKFNVSIGAIGGRSELAYKLAFLGPVILAVVLLIAGIGAQRWLNNESRI